MRLVRLFAWLAGDLLRIRGQVVDDNLKHAFPEMSARARRRLARCQWEHLLRMIVELSHAKRKIHLTNWRDHVGFRNKRAMVKQLLSGRPTVLVSGHFGSFEVGGLVVGMFGFKTFTIARPLDNPYLDRFLNSFRSTNGQNILPKKGSAEELTRRLEEGEAILVLADQAAGRKGCWVDFFGRPASTHKAIALLALTHQAPVLLTYTRQAHKALKVELGCGGIADPREGGPECSGIRELTAWFTARLEDVVRRDPGQYWWLHRRWKDYGRKRKRQPRQAA
jgi:KDO2-lipid IV(A) lauroyltransferase